MKNENRKNGFAIKSSENVYIFLAIVFTVLTYGVVDWIPDFVPKILWFSAVSSTLVRYLIIRESLKSRQEQVLEIARMAIENGISVSELNKKFSVEDENVVK